MRNNNTILKHRIKEYNKIKSIRVGDYIKEPNGILTRVTYIWKFSKKDGGWHVQNGGHNGGGYYLGHGYISYSGGLDHGYNINCLKKTNKLKSGYVWFFDNNISGAGRGKDFKMMFRVWEVKT